MKRPCAIGCVALFYSRGCLVVPNDAWCRSVWAVLYGLEAFTVDRILAQAPDANKAVGDMSGLTWVVEMSMPQLSQACQGRRSSGSRLANDQQAGARQQWAQGKLAGFGWFEGGRDFEREVARRGPPTGAAGNDAPPSSADLPRKASTGVLDRPRTPQQLPPAQDVSVMPAPPARPAAPSIPAKSRTRRNKLSGSGLQPVRATQPGQEQAHPAAAPVEGKRERELRERKAYLKNFWYAAGECTRCIASVQTCSIACCPTDSWHP
ncbi:hypothetical protein HaLaN_03258 [Haematococcus lacustris]|uniref:Uncharacterized protein n=1 Tax=Haematococcus lacustris TaxID=44745 RepID=A0A699YND5_HAELA|nr:hypothetical protein HaLaN_03258 [Haematococcus lacustris]